MPDVIRGQTEPALDADRVIEALTQYRLPEGVVFWSEYPERVDPDEPDVVHEAKAYLSDGLLHFRVYASSDQADRSSHMQAGIWYTDPEFIDVIDEEWMTGPPDFQLLRDYKKAVAEANFRILVNAEVAGACTRHHNVVICSSSPASVTPSYEGAALVGTSFGLAVLLDATQNIDATRVGIRKTATPTPRVTSTSTPTQLPTSAPQPTFTPTPYPTATATPFPTVTPTPKPTASPTPRATATSMPGPVFETLPHSPLLPVQLPLAHAWCFSEVDSASVSWPELLERFSGVAGAAQRLQDWGWQASAFRQFGCNGPPSGEAGWIEVTVHGFGSANAAREAVDFFAVVRLDGSPLRYADAPGVGDTSVALTGPASNGAEFTIYASEGPWLVRVTGVSPGGAAPAANVRVVAEDVLRAQQTSDRTNSPETSYPNLPPTQDSSTYLPSAPDVPHAACFRTQGSGPNRYPDVVAAFARTGAGQDAAEAYGWQDGAWIVFKCTDPPPGRAKQIDISIHQFRDAEAARQVASTVEDFQIPAANESRDCSVAGTLVICVTAYADRGTPAADVRFVLNQVVASAR